MDNLISRMQSEPERWQVEGFFDAMPTAENREAWAAILVGCLDGLSLAQGKACTTTQLAAACAAYPQLVKAGAWGERHFRRTVEDYMRPPSPARSKPPPRGSEAQVDRNRETLQNIRLEEAS